MKKEILYSKIILTLTVLFSIGCTKEKGSSAEELETINIPFNIESLGFNLNGDPLIAGPSQMYEYNRNDKQWHNVIGTFPTSLPFGTLYPLSNDLQGNYYASSSSSLGNSESQIYILKNGASNWVRFKIPDGPVDLLPDFSHYYTFSENQKGEIVVQRRVYVTATSSYNYELYKKDANTATWTLLLTRTEDNLFPFRFCSNGTIYFEGAGGVRVLKAGTSSLVNECNTADINYINFHIQTGYRYINEQGDIFYHTEPGVPSAIYKFDGASTFPSLPTTESSNLEFPGNAGAPYVCYIKGFVYRKSDKAAPFYGTCSQYPTTLWYLFKKTNNKWSSTITNQSQLTFLSNHKDEVYIKYYGATKLLKWNY